MNDRVAVRDINGAVKTVCAIRLLTSDCWKMSEGRAEVWNVVTVKGAGGGSNCKRTTKVKPKAKKKQVTSRLADLDELSIL